MYQTTTFLPEVFLSYLHSLVDHDPSITMIELVSTPLGSGLVQDIYFSSATTTTHRRVFGFDPVNASLSVIHHADYCDILPAA